MITEQNRPKKFVVCGPDFCVNTYISVNNYLKYEEQRFLEKQNHPENYVCMEVTGI